MAGVRVAVAGATGLVGRAILQVLEERLDWAVTELRPLASARSAGARVRVMGSDLQVEELQETSFAGCDVAFFSAGADVSRRYAPRAADDCPIVIDNSSAFRMNPDVPLVVPQVNSEVLTGYRGIIANPNCSTIQMVLALAPLHRAFGLRSVVVSTYQSVSGSGEKGIRALESEIAMGGHAAGSPYPHAIAFNALPHIDVLDGTGWSGEEHKMINETRKIMALPDLQVVPTTVRVPVRVGHSESVYATFARQVTASSAREVLALAPGVTLIDDPDRNEYPYALQAAGSDQTFVGRIRQLPGDDRSLAMWVVADNVRVGAATNAVAIAQRVLAAQPEKEPSHV